jgi:BirA family transcriptional regulator, biotin operon repressor / biotin---[acetyl-CoA-carboxylase] ligase
MESQNIYQSTEPLNKDVIIKALKGTIFSQNLILYQTIDSTNTVTKNLAMKDAPEGTVIITEEQTAGKGRLDRKWFSQSNKNLLFTILLRPPWGVENAFLLTMTLAISAIDEIKNLAGLDVLIKWPNDLYVGKKKLAGMLTEFSMKDHMVDYIIIGLGINVNWTPGEQDGLLYPATSILAETGRTTPRNELLAGILNRFDANYKKALSGETDFLHQRWNEVSLITGKEVDIISPEETIKGTAISIDKSGALILRNNLGKEVIVLSGDVSLRF